MSSKSFKRVEENITNGSNKIKGYTIDEYENGDFDFVADDNDNKVTYIIEKVIEDNESQGYSNVLFDEFASKTLIKDITANDLDKLSQMSRVDVCTVNAFLDDIHNTNEIVVKNLIKIKNLPGTSNEYYINGNIRRFYMWCISFYRSNISNTIFQQLKASDFILNNFNSVYKDMTVEDQYNKLAYKGRFSCEGFSLDNPYFTSEFFFNILTKTLINRPRGEPYIKYQQINEKTLALIYIIIQFRLNLLSKNQAKKDTQLTHGGDWYFGYRKILTKDINWEKAINKIKKKFSDDDEYYI
ncbi:unnamed protein product [Cunninghamella echinulata]